MDDFVNMEFPSVFTSGRDRMIGMIHPTTGDTPGIGVLIVVGGPQYRIGSHRQFLLLARYLASHGIPVMRFDYRGMGDSEGNAIGFEDVGEEVFAAIDELLRQCPQVRKVMLWGLCDAASTLALHAHKDARVCALFLVNPWVRSDAGLAETYVKHYYWRRLLSASFWQKIVSGEMNLIATAKSALSDVFMALPRIRHSGRGKRVNRLSERMALGLIQFTGKIRIVLCGQDLTALEFDEESKSSALWRDLLNDPRATQCRLPPANHTFSRPEWRQQVFHWTTEFIAEL